MRIIERCVAIIFCILLFSFGFILATTHFDQHFFVSEWTGVVSAIGAILAGLGTLIGVFVALYVGGQWRKQNKMSSFLTYYEVLLKLLDCTVELSTIITNRVIESYPHAPELSDYERKRISHLNDLFNELMSSIIHEYARLELLYDNREVKTLNPLRLREQINKCHSVEYTFQPHEVDLPEYETNTSKEFNVLKAMFNKYKTQVRAVINKT